MKKLLFTILIATFCCIVHAQWSDNPEENNRITPLATEIYDHELKVSNDGTSFVVFNRPTGGNTATFIQIIDVNGNMLFSDQGKMISNEQTLSYTMYDQLLFVDDDGNAIVVVVDCRHSSGEDISYTLYKVSPTGEMLWGENGLDLCQGTAYGLIASMNIIQLEDGSYVCSWMVESSSLYIQMQRISKTGELLWNETDARLYDPSVYHEYPYLVNAGNNQFIVVYTKTPSIFNRNVRARKFDTNCAAVWAEDVSIYTGSFGYTPLWVIIRVIPDQMGGAFVGWFDDRNNTWVESTYIAHVKSDGTLGLDGLEGGLKIGYSSLRSFYPEMYFNQTEGFLYVAFRETNDTQTLERMAAQKIKVSSGELMWDADGIEIAPYQNYSLAFYTIQDGGDGNAAIFFTSNTWDPQYFYGWDKNNVTLINSEGEYVWEEQIIEFSTPVGFKGSLLSSPLIFDDFWLTAWNDERVVEGDPGGSKKIYMQKINKDGTLGGISDPPPPPPCETPVGLTVAEITQTSAKLSWTEGNEENLWWDIRFKETSAPSWNDIENLEEKFYILENLTENTAYLWTVRAHCSEDSISNWADENSFTTELNSIKNTNKELITVYSSGKMIHIINSGNNYIEKVQLFDITGKLLYDYVVKSVENVLIPTNFSSNMMVFVKIIEKNEVETFKVLIK